VDLSDLKEAIKGCRLCQEGHSSTVFAAPRYGTGNKVNPRLMILGMNPPQERTRCLNGAWMLHYKYTETSVHGKHELLVRDLVSKLGLKRKEVYATQAVKCPTAGNQPPPRDVVQNCSQYLQFEILKLKPPVILAFGNKAERAVQSLFMQPFGSCPHRRAWVLVGKRRSATLEHGSLTNVYRVQVWRLGLPKLNYRPTLIKTDQWAPDDNFSAEEVNNYYSGLGPTAMLKAPHPSFASRFLDTPAWVASIMEAYEYALSLTSSG